MMAPLFVPIADFFIVVFDAAVFTFLLGVVLSLRCIEQLVICFLNGGVAVFDIQMGACLVNIFCKVGAAVMSNYTVTGHCAINIICHISRYELGKNSGGKWQNKVSRDVLFIERNLNFLKPGGRMAISCRRYGSITPAISTSVSLLLSAAANDSDIALRARTCYAIKNT